MLTLNSSHGRSFKVMKLKFCTDLGPYYISNISKIQILGPTWDRARGLNSGPFRDLHSSFLREKMYPTLKSSLGRSFIVMKLKFSTDLGPYYLKNFKPTGPLETELEKFGSITQPPLKLIKSENNIQILNSC